MTTPLRRLLTEWTGTLAAAGVPSPAADARWLAIHVLGGSPATLALAPAPTARQAAEIDALVARRATREPLQHIVGTAAFLDLQLAVGPGVFVPRPETELLAAAAVERLHGLPPGVRVVDLGTGSGALALAIAVHVPGSHVVAVELSPAALDYARRNVAAHHDRLAATGSRVSVMAGDVRELDLADRVMSRWAPATQPQGGAGVDVVVANPPYIPDAAVPRDPEVRDFDPAAALYGGPDGFAVMRPLIALAAALLRPGGWIGIEHADVQGGADGVPGLLAGPTTAGGAAAFDQVENHRDLAGRPRYTTARRTTA